MVYFFFLSANIISDLLFILSMMELITLNIEGYGITLWIMAVSVFILSLLVCISTEKGELTLKNFFTITIMYFTYCKLWGIVAGFGFYSFIKDTILKQEVKWYKTERFE